MKLPNLFFVLFFASITGLKSQLVKVMTYNIKYDNTNDTVNNWNDRKAAMADLVKSQAPAFVGMQEVLANQLDYLDAALPNYVPIGVGREDGKNKGEYSPIFFDSVAYRLIEHNTFWLSKTPWQVSKGWDAALERICTYGLFEEKATGQKVWVFNTHFDHMGVKARKESMKLIIKKTKKLNPEKLPVILMGDFNLMPHEKPILFIKKKLGDALDMAAERNIGPAGTFNNFEVDAPIDRRIDYIFTKGFNVATCQHIDERLPSGKHISDHLPVIAILLKK